MKAWKAIGKKSGGLSLFLAALLVSAAHWALAQESTPTPAQNAPATGGTTNASSFEIDLPASKQWVDTRIDLREGEKVRITADGTVTYPKGKTFGPAGLPRSIRDVVHEYAVLDGGHGAVIARLGTEATAQPFLVGESLEYEAPVAGRLLVGINQSMKDAAGAEGGFKVRIEELSAGFDGAAAGLVGGPAETEMSAITAELLAEIPRRVSDGKGDPGDMVNALFIGAEEEVVRAFTKAGWVKVDRSVEKTVLVGFEDVIKKKDYLTFPMSTLYLFKRPQDYGFAHAEPVHVMMSRHHLRVWKSPYEVGGKPLWCVAATHDTGFTRDKRDDLVTHKIDPAIDNEREYVNQTLSWTGLVSARGHVMPPDPLTEAKTATGGGFHSDGRILVLMLQSQPTEAQ
jgi:hypothetical protein